MSLNRRQFLRKTAYYGLGAGTLSQLIQTFSLTNALAQGTGSTYRALVCIFLAGGNDSNNMVVPIGAGPYGSYTNYFNERNPQNLALPQPGTGALNDLVAINVVPTAQSGPISPSWAFHPSLGRNFNPGTIPATNLANLFNTGKLAVVANVGPLVQPFGSATQTPRQAYLAAAANQKPFQLFSHSDQIQQWQSCRSDTPSPTGWGGRLADQIDPLSNALPQVTSIAGKATFTVGTTTSPLSIGTGALNTVLVLNGFASGEMARTTAFDFLRTVDRNNQLVAATSDIMSQAKTVAAQLSTDPTLATTFPNTGIGNQLRQVAKVIKANLQNINPMLNRQIFFVQLGGFDTHSNELVGQGGGINASGAYIPGLLGQLNDALVAFYAALQELNAISPGISSRVTAFTMSDFNRTYNPAGSGADTVGTDHAWGHFQLVLGDAVIGQRFYGVPFSGSGGTGTVIPLYTRSGAYDAQSRGLWIPTASVEQYANTLAAWYGLDQSGLSNPASPLRQVFPLLNRFASTNLGFLM
jgi:uncharacterized protein (DUF1501 family)